MSSTTILEGKHLRDEILHGNKCQSMEILNKSDEEEYNDHKYPVPFRMKVSINGENVYISLGKETSQVYLKTQYQSQT